MYLVFLKSLNNSFLFNLYVLLLCHWFTVSCSHSFESLLIFFQRSKLIFLERCMHVYVYIDLYKFCIAWLTLLSWQSIKGLVLFCFLIFIPRFLFKAHVSVCFVFFFYPQVVFILWNCVFNGLIIFFLSCFVSVNSF